MSANREASSACNKLNISLPLDATTSANSSSVRALATMYTCPRLYLFRKKVKDGVCVSTRSATSSTKMLRCGFQNRSNISGSRWTTSIIGSYWGSTGYGCAMMVCRVSPATPAQMPGSATTTSSPAAPTFPGNATRAPSPSQDVVPNNINPAKSAVKRRSKGVGVGMDDQFLSHADDR